MKNKLLYTALLMAAASLTFCGCDNNNEGEDEIQTTDTPLVLTGKNYSFDPKAAGAEWKKGKNIGIFLTTENGEDIINSYENVLYNSIEVPAGYFAPPVGNDPVYFPQDGSKTNLIVYFPYSENLTENRISMDVSNQNSASPFNFLYSNNCKGVGKDNNKVVMELRPVLSQVVLDLVPGDGVTKEYLEEATAILKGIDSKAQFNLLSGQFENLEAKKNITMKASETANSDTAQVIPTASIEGILLYVSLPKMNREFTWELSEKLTELKQGYRYVCTATISLDKISIETTEEPITDWTNGNQGTGNLQENWILRTIDDLPTGDIAAEKTNDKPWQHEIGSWIFLAKGVSTTGTTTVEKEQSTGKNILHCKVYDTGNTWYKTCIAYRMQKPQRTKYSLKFKIKGSEGKQVKCIVFRQDKQIIMIDKEYKPGEKYKGAYSFNLTTDYTEYQVDYDFSRQVNSIWDAATEYTETEEEVLNELFIQFSPITSDSEFYLKDIVLQQKSNE